MKETQEQRCAAPVEAFPRIPLMYCSEGRAHQLVGCGSPARSSAPQQVLGEERALYSCRMDLHARWLRKAGWGDCGSVPFSFRGCR